jgi:hypothetical protein
MTETINSLGQMAGDIAARAAIKYLEIHGKLTPDVADRLAEPLSRHARQALPEALADAKEALNCGMVDVAKETFAASMVLAGINAAKEIA